MFENRTYRSRHHKKGLVSFDVTVKETNLNIQADTDLSDRAVKAVLECRNFIETFISLHPEFADSLVPITNTGPAPRIVQDMMDAARSANVGPMAAVAGAVAQYTGQYLLHYSGQVVVENGGDIFIGSDSETTLGFHAHNSPFPARLGIRVAKRDKPYGVCTSSGTLGHSKSFGTADAATVLAGSCPLADAVATALGNRIKTPADIPGAIEAGRAIPGVQGIVIIKAEKIGLWGDLRLVDLPV
jgi:hypothetical protein